MADLTNMKKQSFWRQCWSPQCHSLSQKCCSACGVACYCGERCSAAHWPQHKADCKRLAADKQLSASPLLSVLEIAFWGRACTEGGRRERMRRLESCVAEQSDPSEVVATVSDWEVQWTRQTRLPPTPPFDPTALLQLVCMPPCVELPDSSYAAFSPLAFLGIFPSKQAALRAAYDSGCCQAQPLFHPPHGPALTFGAHGFEPNPLHASEGERVPRRARRYTINEWACHARVVAKHFKPLPENAELTTPAYYKRRCITIGHHNYSSRLWEQREDVLLVVAKGGGDDYSRELALGRPVRPRGSDAAVAAAAAAASAAAGGAGGFAMFGMGELGGGIQFMGAGALGGGGPLSAADLLELDRRQDSLSPRAEDAIRYSQLIMQLNATSSNEQHRDWLMTEMRRFTDAGGVPGTAVPPLRMAADLLTAVRHARRMSAHPHPSEVLKLIADLRRASPGGMRGLALVIGESRLLNREENGTDESFLSDIFGQEEMQRLRAEATVYVSGAGLS